MEDQGVLSRQTFLVKKFQKFPFLLLLGKQDNRSAFK